MFIRIAIALTLLVLTSANVQAQLPKRDLTIDLRQIEEAQESSTGYRAGGAATNNSIARTPQSLVIRNGEKGSLRLLQSVPMQWVKSAQSQNSNLTVPGAEASSSGGGVTQALHWFDGGTSITVTPKWLGGKKDVVLEIAVQQMELQTTHDADLPHQTRNSLITTVTAPLNTWLTVATSGKGPLPSGSYSSAGPDTRRSLQIRVQAP